MSKRAVSPTCLEIAGAARLTNPKRAGNELCFLCPNHDDHDPSLKINMHKDCWGCFRCGVSGNWWTLAAFLNKLSPEDKPRITSWLKKRGLLNGNPFKTESGASSKPTTWNKQAIKCLYDYKDND